MKRSGSTIEVNRADAMQMVNVLTKAHSTITQAINITTAATTAYQAEAEAITACKASLEQLLQP